MRVTFMTRILLPGGPAVQKDPTPQTGPQLMDVRLVPHLHTFYISRMLLSLETENFRMLAANHVSLGPMHLLVGQNGTGKTTFLEAIRLLSSLQKELGVLRVLEELAPSFFDLCFDPERPIAFAAEIAVPQG